MTREERIELLQDQAQHNRISAKELGEECDKYKIYLHDEVLSPIGYNTCDRCGDYGDSELDFFWVDGFDWEEDNPKDQAIIKALGQEGTDYCAICWDCVNKLAEKGGYCENHDNSN